LVGQSRKQESEEMKKPDRQKELLKELTDPNRKRRPQKKLTKKEKEELTRKFWPRETSITPQETETTTVRFCRMVIHLELETRIPPEMGRSIIRVFKEYWRENITLGQLTEALHLIGYDKDLDQDGLHKFLNKVDVH
jgi:hypothetical protein